MLAAHDDCAIIGEADNGADAVDLILRERPDLVFLDIKMPELDGFEVLSALTELDGLVPGIVFVTAFDAFAVKAFEVGALDYLLKPFDLARFDRTLASAVERLAARSLLLSHSAERTNAALAQYLGSMRPTRAFPSRFLVRRGRQMQFVRAADIDWLEAQGNYVRLHIAGKAHLLRDTMTALDDKLDPELFIRVHRSAIVNIDRVSHIEPHVHGEFMIVMRDGARLTTSAAYSPRLRQLLR